MLSHKIIIVLFIIFISIGKITAQTLDITNTKSELLSSNLYYYIDSTSSLSYQEINTIFLTGQGNKVIDQEVFISQPTKAPIWFFTSMVSHKDDLKVLHLDIAFLNYIDLFLEEDQQWTHFPKVGKKMPQSNRGSLQPRDYAWKLLFKKNETKNILFKVETPGSIIFPLKIHDIDNYIIHRNNADLYYGIFFGILLIMIIYNLIIFLFLREVVYLYYVGSVLSTLLAFSAANGFLLRYVVPDYWFFKHFLAESMVCLLAVFTSLFAIHFLELKKVSKFSYYNLMALVIFSIPLGIYFYQTNNPVGSNKIITALSISLIIAGFLAFRKKQPYAGYYLLGWSFYIIFGLATSLRNQGILPHNTITHHGAEVGSVIEVCLLALALAKKYSSLRKEKEALKEEKFFLIENQKKHLERQVEKRTIELNDTVEELNTTLTMVNKQNKDIKSSINYAKRIQRAVLPNKQQLKEKFKDIVFIYHPKDIVSGDFVFYEENETFRFLVVADCTGHGVPGAFMSLIGTSILHHIIQVIHIQSPSEILEMLHYELIKRVSDNEYDIKDGMDITILAIEKSTHQASFAGARNSIIIINNNNELKEIKGERRDVGGRSRIKEKAQIAFKDHDIDLSDTKWLYMYSDGYSDQFGEVQNRKFYIKNLRELLLNSSSLSGEEQEEFLWSEFKKWKGNKKQTDDVTLVGVKL